MMSVVTGALATCERCWSQCFIPEQADKKKPENWHIIDSILLCPDCAQEYHRLKKSFMQDCSNCMHVNTSTGNILCESCKHWDEAAEKNHWTPAGEDGQLHHPRPSTERSFA